MPTEVPKPTKMVQSAPVVAAPVIPHPQEYPSNIPKVDTAAVNIPTASNPSQPDYSQFKGRYKKTTGDDAGEEYALAVVADDGLGKTHHALNSRHYWAGTAAEFKNQFDVSDGDKRVQVDGEGAAAEDKKK